MSDHPTLDDLMPEYDFSERHRRRIDAPADDVWTALTGLTLGDLRITRPLMALRHLTRTPKMSGPLLTSGPLQLLDVDAGRYAVAGAVAQPWRPRAARHPVDSASELLAFDRPGWTKYLTDFRIDAVKSGCILSTETRGTSTDAAARRRFAVYWLLIRMPSGLIRRDMLRAVAARAEARNRQRRAKLPV